MLSRFVHSESDGESQSVVTKGAVSRLFVDGQQGGKTLPAVKRTRPFKSFWSHRDEPSKHERFPDYEAHLTGQSQERYELCYRSLFVGLSVEESALAAASRTALRFGGTRTLYVVFLPGADHDEVLHLQLGWYC